MSAPLLEESLFAFLSSDTAVASFVESRIYGLIAPQGAQLPRIIYSRIATQRTQTLCATDGKVRTAMQVDCYSKTFKEAKQLAKVVQQTLTDFTGDMMGTRVSTVILDSEVDLDDPDPGLYRVSQTYFIWYKEE